MDYIWKKDIEDKVTRIQSVGDDELHIILANQDPITLSHYHGQDCCESVYADWSVVDLYIDKIEGNIYSTIAIKPVADAGLLLEFRDYSETVKVFIPCYNIQNGYYSDKLELVVNDKTKLDISHYVESECY